MNNPQADVHMYRRQWDQFVRQWRYIREMDNETVENFLMHLAEQDLAVLEAALDDGEALRKLGDRL